MSKVVKPAGPRCEACGQAIGDLARIYAFAPKPPASGLLRFYHDSCEPSAVWRDAQFVVYGDYLSV
jgi:hypothetical protein